VEPKQVQRPLSELLAEVGDYEIEAHEVI
jgi:hypothetical protein